MARRMVLSMEKITSMVSSMAAPKNPIIIFRTKPPTLETTSSGNLNSEITPGKLFCSSAASTFRLSFPRGWPLHESRCFRATGCC